MAEEVVGDAFEQLLARHRKEKKDLQAKIVGMKKTAKSGSKKQQKEAQDEATKLEKEIEERHKKEKAEAEKNTPTPAASAPEYVNGSEPKEEDGGESGGEEFYKERKVKGKKQKQQDRKAEQQRKRAEAAAADEEAAKTSLRTIEIEAVNKVLSDRGLKLVDIPPDGDCLFNALAHQLDLKTNPSAAPPTGADLRRRAAAFLRSHPDDFLPFLADDQGEPLQNMHFDQYCAQVEQPASEGGEWGGEPELRALSESLERKIEVIQPDCRVLVFGEQYAGTRPLIITYHRHAYGLGEHYNSTKA